MAIFRQMLESRATKGLLGHPQDPVIARLWSLMDRTKSGQVVTPETAMEVAAVYACVRVIAETIGSLPLQLFRNIQPRGREKATNHYLYNKLYMQPNRWQTSLEFREMLQGHALLRGNGYARKIVSNAGRIEELIPLHPDRVYPYWVEEGVRAYEYHPKEGGKQILLDDEVFHLAGLGFDGLKGFNPIEYQRETIGLTQAANEYGARFYENDGTPTGVITVQGSFKDEDSKKKFKEQFKEMQTGENRHRTAVLEKGMDYKPIGINLEDAQYIEGRKFQIAEIARIFRVPPHMISDLERATFSNIEHQGLEFVTYTLMPWLVRWEQAIWRDMLITSAEKRNYFAKFNVSALLRGDLKSRYEAYQIGITNAGFITRNEAREEEDMNPREDMDEPLIPQNMMVVGDEPKEDETGAADNGNGDQRLNQFIHAAIGRVLRKESASVAKCKTSDDLAEFYRGFTDFVASVLMIDRSAAETYTERAAARATDAMEQDTLSGYTGRLAELHTPELLTIAGADHGNH